MGRAIVVLAAFFCIAAARPPRRLHLAAIVPEGTYWASALHRFSREVEAATNGSVVPKWTLGGIGGDEPTLLKRIIEGDLDGAAGAALCEELAPSLRVLELIGLARSDREAATLLNGMRARVEEEVRTTPFRVLAVSTGLGHRVLISRDPVRTFDELRRGRWWLWNLDGLLATQLAEMGVHVVPLPLDQASPAFDAGTVDGFITVPGAAVSFGFYVRSQWFTDLASSYLPGCLVMSARSFDALTPRAQAAIHAAAARLELQFEHAERKMRIDLDGTFSNGLRELPMSPEFRTAFLTAGREAIDQLGDKLVPPGLLEVARAILRRGK